MVAGAVSSEYSGGRGFHDRADLRSESPPSAEQTWLYLGQHRPGHDSYPLDQVVAQNHTEL